MPAGRPLTAETKLAQAIRADGRTAYLIGALAGLRAPQISAYCNGAPIPFMHVRRLSAVLECDPEDIT